MIYFIIKTTIAIMEQENAELKQIIIELKKQLTDMLLKINVNHTFNEGIPDDNINLINLNSNAIYSIKSSGNIVNIAYKSNHSREYSYTCSNIDTFKQDMQEIASYGKYVNQCIKNGILFK